MADTYIVPAFPLANAVLFPQSVLPLHIFEERYKLMVSELANYENLMLVGLPRAEDDQHLPREIAGIGKVTITKAHRDGRRNISVMGTERVRIVQIMRQHPYILAEVETLAEIPASQNLVPEVAKLRGMLLNWLIESNAGQEHNWLLNLVGSFADAGALADFVAFYLIDNAELKQTALEMLDADMRFELVYRILRRAIYLRRLAQQEEGGPKAAEPPAKPPRDGFVN